MKEMNFKSITNQLIFLGLALLMVGCKPSQDQVKRKDLVGLKKTISGSFANTTISQQGYTMELSRFFRLAQTDSITEISSNKNRLMVTFYDYLGGKHCKTFDGKFRKKYFQFHLEYQTISLPPLLIRHMEDRVRMSLDKQGNLVIYNYTASQGMFLVFGASHSGELQYVFNKK